MIVDLFAGPGGWDEGGRAAGYVGPLVGIEWDHDACRTAVTAGHLRVRADVSAYPTTPFTGRAAGLIASPPCPTFSSAGNGAGKLDMDKVHDRIRAFANGRQPAEVEWADDRSRLTAEPMRWAYALRPRWIACEQVPAVLPLWQHTAMLLRGLGYKTWTGVLSSEEYGVPQTRKRAILIARADGLPALPPDPTHQAYRAGKELQVEDDLFGSPLPPPVSMAEALGWGVSRPSWTVSAGGTEAGGGVEVFANAAAREQLQQSIRMCPNYGTGGDSQDRGERRADEPAPTVTGKVGRNLWMAPAGATSEMVEPRSISDPAHTITGKATASWVVETGRAGQVTVAEAGVLQSFPANYPWQGGKTKQYLQVGNAVPPRFAASILAPLLDEADRVAAAEQQWALQAAKADEHARVAS